MFPYPRNSKTMASLEGRTPPLDAADSSVHPFRTDQAASLRKVLSGEADVPENGKAQGRSMAVLSGKGGVGKTNITVNLALAAGQEGARVTILDADLGLANVDILFGMMPRYNLSHVVTGERLLEDVIVTVDENVKIIPGGAGIQHLTELDMSRREELLSKLSALESSEDILLVDTGAGIYENVMAFALAVETVLLVTTPEPTSIRDAYGVLKALSRSEEGRKKDVRLLVNMAYSAEDAHAVAERIQMAANQFLGMSVPFAGYVPWDPNIRKAVQKRRPFYLSYPSTAASKALSSIARQLFLGEKAKENLGAGISRGIQEFFVRIMHKR